MNLLDRADIHVASERHRSFPEDALNPHPLTLGLLMVAAAGCPHRPTAMDPPVVTEVRAIHGDVRVVPGLPVHPELVVDQRDFVGPLPAPRLSVRVARTAQIASLPGEVGLALPGAVGAELGDGFRGAFKAADWPDVARTRVLRALERGHGLDAALGDAARSIGGEASLITWVDVLQAYPLSLDAPPGDMVQTPRGSVLIDHVEEPYLVDVGVGMALVGSDGTVLLRFRDDVQSILSEGRPPKVVGREVARRLADEVARLWTPTP